MGSKNESIKKKKKVPIKENSRAWWLQWRILKILKEEIETKEIFLNSVYETSIALITSLHKDTYRYQRKLKASIPVGTDWNEPTKPNNPL